MANMPPICIVLLTYGGTPKRCEYTLRTIQAARANLRYSGELLWYVADDGSPKEHVDAVMQALTGARVIGSHSEHIGYGAGANRGWYMALQNCDLSLWLEDDWECYGLDLDRYARALIQHDWLGMVRLGHLPINLHCDTVGVDGAMYLQMHWGQQYCFSGNPGLRHRRAREAWGAYPEGLDPGKTELAYDAQVNEHRGPRIVWPVALGEWGAWGHIGEEKSYVS